MKKMLYIMPVDWGWIAQRPHFLAWELTKYYDIDVVYLKQYIKQWKSQKELAELPNSRHGLYFPKQEKIGLLKRVSDFTMKKAIGDLKEYDAALIGEPLSYKFLENFKGKIIYDCMDNYAAMQSCDTEMKLVKKYEDKVLSKAAIIFASSLKLKEYIDLRCPHAKTILVRNGYNHCTDYALKIPEIKALYKLGYIGTVSSWLDFELIEHCLSRFNNIEIHLIGPVHGYAGTRIKGLIFEGVVEHEKIFETIARYDCLIMPFIVNDIVLSVDPVKLYEYIDFGKCIISVYYEEIERFKDFVYFYKTQEEFYDLIDKLCRQGFPPKYSSEQRLDFLRQNSWAIRGKIINESLEHIWDKA